MKRTTIMLPDDLRKRAADAAHKAEVSLAEFVRQALEAKLGSEDRDWSEDPFFANSTIIQDQGPTDMAQKHDDYLYGPEQA